MTENDVSRSTLSARRVLITCAVGGVMLPGLTAFAAPAGKPVQIAKPAPRMVLSPFTLSRVPVKTPVAVVTTKTVVVPAAATPASGYVPNPDTEAGSTRDPNTGVTTTPVVVVNDPAGGDDF